MAGVSTKCVVLLVALLVCTQVSARHLLQKRESTWDSIRNWGSGAIDTVREQATEHFNTVSDAISTGVGTLRDNYEGSDLQKAVNSASKRIQKVATAVRTSATDDSDD